MPLEIVSKLRPTVEARLAVAPLPIWKIPVVEIGRLTVAKLATRMQANIESGPIAKRRSRCWRNSFTFFPTVHFRPGKRGSCQRAASGKYTH